MDIEYWILNIIHFYFNTSKYRSIFLFAQFVIHKFIAYHLSLGYPQVEVLKVGGKWSIIEIEWGKVV